MERNDPAETFHFTDAMTTPTLAGSILVQDPTPSREYRFRHTLLRAGRWTNYR